MTRNSHWQGKRVVVIGAARQGIALTRFLVQHGADVILNDMRPKEKLEAARNSLMDLSLDEQTRVEWVCGSHPVHLVDEADLVCPSGGVPLTLPMIREAITRGIPLSNDSQIFLEEAECNVIGITGSAGKTTTTSLLGSIAKQAYRNADQVRVWVGGNIGSPLIANLADMRTKDIAIMELSSFQLEIMTESPHIAAVLNITPNHLDRHGTMAAYAAAKARILKFQSEGDVAILGRDDPGSIGLIQEVHGRLFTFGIDRPVEGEPGTYLEMDQLYYWDGKREEQIITRGEIQLRGDHNLLNVLAACAISAAAGIGVDEMREGIRNYTGEPHRLEYVRSYKGAAWYNDSIATAPERAMAAIRSFDEPIILLAGGQDKDLPWDDFSALVRQRVDHLILFGEAADKIKNSVETNVDLKLPQSITKCKSLKEAVATAAKIVEPGDVVLLSPGGTSFDEFHDFEERGKVFRKWVSELV